MQTTTTLPMVRPERWRELYDVRAAGLVPRDQRLTFVLDAWFPVMGGLEITHDLDPRDVDYSPCAGLDTVLILDGETTRYQRLRDVVAGILRSDPASLYLLDAAPGLKSRGAWVKLDFPRRWINEQGGEE